MTKIISTTTNFVVPFLVIFLSVLALFVYPRVYPPAAPSDDPTINCFVGTKPDTYDQEIKGMPSSINSDPATLADYVLIRKNVWAGLEFKIHTWLVQKDIQPGYDLYFPDSDMANTTMTHDLHPGPEGVVFLVKNDSTSVKKALWADINKGGLMKNLETGEFLLQDIYQMDVYQNRIVFDVATKQGLRSYTDPDALFKCGRETMVGVNQVVIPEQKPSETNEQLQLEWFVFYKSTIWGVHCKPAVYLYPPQKQLINVKVYPAGTLTFTDPVYDNKTGWTVDAYPDGQTSTNYNLQPTTYPYLYFESKVPDQIIRKPTKGWVIESGSGIMSQASSDWFDPLETQFQTLLPQLGLNSLQTKDFIDYWKKALPYSPYYFVGVIDQDNVNQIERLEITPTPDSVNRVRIYFERLDAPKQVEAPHLEAKSLQFKASSFNVVEWGGMVKNDPNHPFTCSQ